MNAKIETFGKPFLKKSLPDIRPGDRVLVHAKIREGGKERVQVFEGIIIARKHGKKMGSTITVRKIISGVGVEKIFPLYSPHIEKIEIARRAKVRRAKLYYLRTSKGKKARLKRKELREAIAPEEPPDQEGKEEKPSPVEPDSLTEETR